MYFEAPAQESTIKNTFRLKALTSHGLLQFNLAIYQLLKSGY